MSKYAEVIERVEKATGPDEALDADICIALQYGGENSEGAKNVRAHEDWPGDILFEIDEEECCNKTPALTASIDAALALMGKHFPGKVWYVRGHANGDFFCQLFTHEVQRGLDPKGTAPTAPLAILLSFFRALEAKENG